MIQESLLAYIPMDRRHAMARGETLPDRTRGAALFADISGFTPLTEALVRELGPQRGAEELTGYLNQVYDALIDEVHRWGGSAIAFAGDAVTCWFDGDSGLNATACALAMQDAMLAFRAVETPGGSIIELSMKAAVAVGSARRFLVGDPQSRVIDALAGATLERLAAAEHEANRGEVLLAPQALAALDGLVEISEIRQAQDGREFGVVARLPVEPQPPELPHLPWQQIGEAEVETWLLPSVYRRLQGGLGEFLAEIRPTVAVFMRFSGIDYDGDEDAGRKLDATIRAVQAIVDRYEGTLIDLNIGDKGSYLYVNFGAPIAHENNSARAATAALELRDLPRDLSFLDPLQIGIAQGRMRAGAYGGVAHRTYGVLGDSVNLSARLMMASRPGSILVQRDVQASIADFFAWQLLEPIRVKGKSEPVEIAELQAVLARSAMHLPGHEEDEPLVGRNAEMSMLRDRMELAAVGQGQIISLIAEAGLGKSRLVAEALNLTAARGFVAHGGECESYGLNSSYLVWHPILRTLFGLDPTWDTQRQIRVLTEQVTTIDPSLLPRLPLLGPALQLSIPDNQLTGSFDAKLRKSLLEEMLVTLIAGFAAREPLVLVLEDCHWLDALSHDLLEVVARSSADLPVLILLTLRHTDLERIREARVSSLPNYAAINLTPLREQDLVDLARLRLERRAGDGRDPAVTETLARRIAQQAEGNPFYLEELVNYVGEQIVGKSDADALEEVELPSSLQSLVLSRLDQLGERRKTLLKVASVIGRVFRASWLAGVYPELGSVSEIRSDLSILTAQNMTVYDPSEADDSYSFRHIITRGVIYDSLLHKMRTNLHEQIGLYLESSYPDAQEQFLDLLAYHFEHGQILDKKRYYLRHAGEVAQRTYANEAAIHYFRNVLPLLPSDEQIDITLRVGEVEKLVGNWDEAHELFQEALELAQSTDNQSAAGWSRAAIGEMLRMQGNYTQAVISLQEARAVFEHIQDRQGQAQVMHYSGTIAAQQGDLDEAEALYEESLALRRELDDQVGITNLLNNLAIISEYQGDFAESRQRHEEALTIRRELGDRRMIAFSLSNLGHILNRLGDYSGARAHLEEAVALHREIGDQYSLATALDNLGNVVRAQGGYEEARQMYAESLRINLELGDGWASAYLLEDIARLFHLDEQNSDALVLLGAAGTLRESIDAPLPPSEQDTLAALQDQIQLELGPAFSRNCLQTGKDMSLKQAIAFARQAITHHSSIN